MNNRYDGVADLPEFPSDYTERLDKLVKDLDRTQMIYENFIDIETILDYIEDPNTTDEDRSDWFEVIRFKLAILKRATTEEE